jgi:hypothetical protein
VGGRWGVGGPSIFMLGSQAVLDDRTPASAPTRARRQLGRVLFILAALDVSVIVWVIGVALVAPSLGLAGLRLLFAILLGLGGILGIRIWLAVRLRRRSGDVV